MPSFQNVILETVTLRDMLHGITRATPPPFWQLGPSCATTAIAFQMRHPALGNSCHALHGEYFECRVYRGYFGCGCNGPRAAIARVRVPFLTAFTPIYRMNRYSPGPNERPGQYPYIVEAIPLAIKRNSLYSPEFACYRQGGRSILTHSAICRVQRRICGP